ncbi:MAG: phosphomannomutase, partial [Desulfovibrionaceae bacterium]
MRCFKAYDVRGRVPGELNEDLAYRMGRAMAQWLSARRCCVGHDIRLSSPGLAGALCRGLTDSGCDALRLGECGTEEVYFATAHLGLDGGIMVTASHNPADWNGMKLVREEARPISGDTGLFAIRDRTKAPGGPVAAQAGSIKDIECREAYIEHLLGYVDLA